MLVARRGALTAGFPQAIHGFSTSRPRSSTGQAPVFDSSSASHAQRPQGFSTPARQLSTGRVPRIHRKWRHLHSHSTFPPQPTVDGRRGECYRAGLGANPEPPRSPGHRPRNRRPGLCDRRPPRPLRASLRDPCRHLAGGAPGNRDPRRGRGRGERRVVGARPCVAPLRPAWPRRSGRGGREEPPDGIDRADRRALPPPRQPARHPPERRRATGRPWRRRPAKAGSRKGSPSWAPACGDPGRCA